MYVLQLLDLEILDNFSFPCDVSLFRADQSGLVTCMVAGCPERRACKQYIPQLTFNTRHIVTSKGLFVVEFFLFSYSTF
jgi:hypothetical protein